MVRFIAIACFTLGLFAMPAAAQHKDWKAELNKLERMPKSPDVIKAIAVCSNNLALEYMDAKKWNEAERYMRKAYDLKRNEKLYQRNLAVIYTEQAWDLYSKRESRNKGGSMHRRAKLLAQRALTFDRTAAAPHVIIGRIEYDNQDIRAAKRSFEKAYKLNPQFPNLRSYMQKVSREEDVEKKFAKTRNSFFEIRYSNKNIDSETAQGLKLAMDTARQVVGRDYAFHPKHKIVLLIYSTEDYANLRLGPHWSGGLYDGKIRLPLDGQHNLKYAVAALFHEYTHAVHDDLCRSNCPRWLNEGLAEIQGYKIDGNPIIHLESAAKSDNLIPLGDLSQAFGSGSVQVVKLAYEQSHSIAQYLVKKYGYRRITRVMSELSNEAPFEIAIRKGFATSQEQLEMRWKKWLLVEFAKESNAG